MHRSAAVSRSADDPVYAYHEHGRRPLTVVALLLSVAMLVFAAMQDAPWWFLPPVLFAVFGLGWMVIADPVSGTRVTRRELSFYSGNWSRCAPLDSVAWFEVVEWSDGGPSGRVHLRCGGSVSVPSVCMTDHPAFVQSLRDVGVALHRN